MVLLSLLFTERYRSGHNEAVLKTVWGQPHMGSNPILSERKRVGKAGPFPFGENWKWDSKAARVRKQSGGLFSRAVTEGASAVVFCDG